MKTPYIVTKGLLEQRNHKHSNWVEKATEFILQAKWNKTTINATSYCNYLNKEPN